WILLERPAGPGKPVAQYVNGRLRNGALRLDAFPYPLTDVSGSFEGPFNDWAFSNFRGRQGLTELIWKGRLHPDDEGRQRLDLDFDARNAACDATLYTALPPLWREAWNEINPQGNLHVFGHLEWYEGSAPTIGLKAELRDGKLAIRSFPLPFVDVRADV